MEQARKRNVAVLAMKPFGGGRIADAPLCLRFLKGDPGVFPCTGIERPREMAENLDVWVSSETLTDKDREEMGRLTEQMGDRFCRGYGHCLPCPEEIPNMLKENIQFYKSL